MKKYRNDIREKYGQNVWLAVITCVYGNFNSVKINCYKSFCFRKYRKGCKV